MENDGLSELDAKLLAIVQDQTSARAGHYGGMRWDCQSVCSPAWRSTLLVGGRTPLKQPGEIWEPFLQMIAARPVLAVRERVELAARHCESPIEELLFLSLVALGSILAEQPVVVDGGEPRPFEGPSPVYSIAPQQQVGKYRIDLVVTMFKADLDIVPIDEGREEYVETWHKGVLLVECDGHEFHEKTKEQASHDKKKDRDLQTAGFKIFRYTGSDIWKRPMDRAAEILTAVEQIATDSAPVETIRTPRDLPWRPKTK